VACTLTGLLVATAPAGAADRPSLIDIRPPVYSAAQNALLFPIDAHGSIDRAGIVALNLTDWSVAAMPAPCGLGYQKLVPLRHGSVLAAWGYRIEEDCVPRSDPRHPGYLDQNGRRIGGLRPQPVYANPYDIMFFSLPEFNLIHGHSAVEGERIDDISTLDDTTLYFSVLTHDSIGPRPEYILKTVSASDWSEATAWPGPGTWDWHRDRQLRSMGAPLAQSDDGGLIVGGTLVRSQRDLIKHMVDPPQNLWTLYPGTNRLGAYTGSAYPDAWQKQRLGDTLYFTAKIGDETPTRPIFGLKALRNGHESVAMVLHETPEDRFYWLYVFDLHRERVIVFLYTRARLRLLRLSDGQLLKEMSALDLFNATPRAHCGMPSQTAR
jgi:hypothetical protein